jgi:hypothetical protein
MGKKRRKDKSSSSSDSSESTSYTSSQETKVHKKKSKKKEKLHSTAKKSRKEKRKEKKLLKKRLKKSKQSNNSDKESSENEDFSVPIDLMNMKANAPETREQYEARQNVVKRVLDPETGRYRLIKGDGEVIEEIVSRDRHKEINKQATIGDGECFQKNLKFMNK